jgi:hypothetical protein
MKNLIHEQCLQLMSSVDLSATGYTFVNAKIEQYSRTTKFIEAFYENKFLKSELRITFWEADPDEERDRDSVTVFYKAGPNSAGPQGNESTADMRLSLYSFRHGFKLGDLNVNDNRRAPAEFLVDFLTEFQLASTTYLNEVLLGKVWEEEKDPRDEY